ncbi:extracellular solute-binding protein [Micromonospora chalcea]|uniref:Arabinogalactan oligomer/maltooligosaccharide transport system substrate-binding protein n=1 Tax=Micromonospora echinospora TaxID=1877 RepID=A0ABR6M7Z8_MICEC|nr:MULTISPECIES: maltose ABC transporter substrate-binding protein [Micromonospora]MBB5111508.1 arabinogalactan oligomer/maltooligosaccharide transport system substrate-binding protein [Micromonospora echinospora]MBQ1045415.1 maltose ABC transporter substrate-binding protein [Micromonospora sp. C72]MBQ1055436.1 maltose ABC transporter substrate-binding protein [Micromonospora sp. C32]OKJ47315.1 sugar ABC transporter substrate-binding protein [Micromonospora sp. TSRI0369]
MRIRTAGVVAVLGLALAASGCGDSGSDDKPAAGESAKATGGKLVIWADDKRTAALKPFAEEFGKENGVTVEVQAVSKDLQTNFVTASQQGSGPDVVVGAHDWIGNLVQNGAIDPVQLPAEQKAGFNETAIKAVTFNGQLYGVPYATENVALIRNTELAPEAPKTIEDLVAAGKKLKAEKKASEILCLQSGQNGDAYHIYPLYTSGGGYLFGTTANGDYDPKDLGVGKPESIAAFQKIAKLGEKGEGALKRSITGENSIATFTGKKCAFLVSGPWAVADAKKANISYDISPVPGFAGGQEAQPFVGVQAFYVAAKGKNKALAQEFVTNYVTKPELAVALYKAEPRPPALTAAFDQVKGEDADLAKFSEAGKNGQVLPAIPAMAAIWDPFGKAEAAIIGGADPAKTITAAGKTIQGQIK